MSDSITNSWMQRALAAEREIERMDYDYVRLKNENDAVLAEMTLRCFQLDELRTRLEDCEKDAARFRETIKSLKKR